MRQTEIRRELDRIWVAIDYLRNTITPEPKKFAASQIIKEEKVIEDIGEKISDLVDKEIIKSLTS